MQICVQVAQCMSIVTACTVYLKPFLDALESGFIQIGDLRRQNVAGFGYANENDESVRNRSRVASSFIKLSTKSSKSKSTLSDSIGLQSIQKIDDSRRSDGEELGNIVEARSEAHGVWDGNTSSQIIQTRTWTVEKDGGSGCEDHGDRLGHHESSEAQVGPGT